MFNVAKNFEASLPSDNAEHSIPSLNSTITDASDEEIESNLDIPLNFREGDLQHDLLEITWAYTNSNYQNTVLMGVDLVGPYISGGPNCEYTCKLCSLGLNSKSAEIRSKCVKILPLTDYTMAYFISRTRDLNEDIRIAVYKRLESIDLENLKEKERLEIIYTGLMDRSSKVKEAFEHLLLKYMYNNVEGNEVKGVDNEVDNEVDKENMDNSENMGNMGNKENEGESRESMRSKQRSCSVKRESNQNNPPPETIEMKLKKLSITPISKISPIPIIPPMRLPGDILELLCIRKVYSDPSFYGCLPSLISFMLRSYNLEFLMQYIQQNIFHKVDNAEEESMKYSSAFISRMSRVFMPRKSTLPGDGIRHEDIYFLRMACTMWKKKGELSILDQIEDIFPDMTKYMTLIYQYLKRSDLFMVVNMLQLSLFANTKLETTNHTLQKGLEEIMLDPNLLIYESRNAENAVKIRESVTDEEKMAVIQELYNDRVSKELDPNRGEIITYMEEIPAFCVRIASEIMKDQNFPMTMKEMISTVMNPILPDSTESDLYGTLDSQIKRKAELLEEIKDQLAAVEADIEGCGDWDPSRLDTLNRQFIDLQCKQNVNAISFTKLMDKLDDVLIRALSLTSGLLQTYKINRMDDSIYDLEQNLIGYAYSKTRNELVKMLSTRCLGLLCLTDKTRAIKYFTIFDQGIRTLKTEQTTLQAITSLKAINDNLLAHNLLQKGDDLDEGEKLVVNSITQAVDTITDLMYHKNSELKFLAVECIIKLICTNRIENPVQLLVRLMIIMGDTTREIMQDARSRQLITLLMKNYPILSPDRVNNLLDAILVLANAWCRVKVRVDHKHHNLLRKLDQFDFIGIARPFLYLISRKYLEGKAYYDCTLNNKNYLGKFFLRLICTAASHEGNAPLFEEYIGIIAYFCKIKILECNQLTPRMQNCLRRVTENLLENTPSSKDKTKIERWGEKLESKKEESINEEEEKKIADYIRGKVGEEVSRIEEIGEDIVLVMQCTPFRESMEYNNNNILNSIKVESSKSNMSSNSFRNMESIQRMRERIVRVRAGEIEEEEEEESEDESSEEYNAYEERGLRAGGRGRSRGKGRGGRPSVRGGGRSTKKRGERPSPATELRRSILRISDAESEISESNGGSDGNSSSEDISYYKLGSSNRKNKSKNKNKNKRGRKYLGESSSESESEATFVNTFEVLVPQVSTNNIKEERKAEEPGRRTSRTPSPLGERGKPSLRIIGHRATRANKNNNRKLLHSIGPKESGNILYIYIYIL